MSTVSYSQVHKGLENLFTFIQSSTARRKQGEGYQIDLNPIERVGYKYRTHCCVIALSFARENVCSALYRLEKPIESTNMKLNYQLVAFSLLSLPLASAGDGYKHYSEDELIVQSCRPALKAMLCPGDTKRAYKCVCKTPQGLGSWLNCIYDHSSVYDEKMDEFVIEYCKENANKTYTRQQLQKQYDNATEYMVDPSTIDGFNSSAISYVPVQWNKKSFKIGYDSYTARYKNEDWGMWMGAGLIGFWGFMVLLGGIYNVLNRTVFIAGNLKSHPVNLIRRYISMSPTLGRKHSKPATFLKYFGGYIPLRIESIVIFIYTVLIIIFSAVGYTFVENHVIWPNKTIQISRYVGDRTGIIVNFTFLLSFLFAGRNNFLIWITGWSQSTFLTFHKWTSRVNFLLVVAHAGAYHLNSDRMGKLTSRYKTPWMRWGAVAVVCAGVIMFQASYAFRRTQYEVFLLLHIALVVFFLIGTWIHLRKFEYQMFAYTMAAIWCFDRFVRIVRLSYFGVQKAQVTVVSDEVLKVVVPRHKLWKGFPGSYGYLHYLTPKTFWQSHPFTCIDCDEGTVTFITKIKGGVTSVIYNRVIKNANKTDTIPILLEGPYGEQKPLHKFSTALYYTGSTGVSSSYAYIRDCARRGVQQHVKFYWVIRNWNSLDWFYDELLELKKTNAEVIIYVSDPSSSHGTRHLSGHSSEASSGDESEKNESHDDEDKGNLMPSKELSFIQFRMGRPNMEEIVAKDLQEANGHTAVVACGHSSMVDDIRYAVSNNLDATNGRVEYIEDLQVW